jgi:phosphohistidine phosphatase
MKTLILVRHAKSSKDDPSLPDKERPLNDRGQREAPEMGERLAKRDSNPDLIVSSPALRALATAQLVAKELGYPRKDIEVDERVYQSDVQTLLDVIHQFGDKRKRVMLVGHNPEFSELAQRLDSGIDELPTCAVVEFAFDSKSWSDVGKVKPEKVVFEAPKKS